MTNAGKIEEATPRPWSVLDDHPIKACLHIVGVGARWREVASLYGCEGKQDHEGVWRGQYQRQANAELIVRAVNAWDDPDALRARLRELEGTQ